MDDAEHAIRQDERNLVLDFVRRELRAAPGDTGEISGDLAEDLIGQIMRAVATGLPGHGPGAA